MPVGSEARAVLYLAFYKGHGRMADQIIRWATRSGYSHVEIILGDTVEGRMARAISASGRDGGVRETRIDFGTGRWDIIAVPWADPAEALARARACIGLHYDWMGLVLSQVLHLRRSAPDRWFCSELVAHALGLPTPQTLSPGDLYLWVRAVSDLLTRQGGAERED